MHVIRMSTRSALRHCTLAAALVLAPLPQPALAQDDDRSLIVGFLEDQLSDASRQIRIEGFEGALSSRATLEELTIADADGVWLTLRGAVLDWNRTALFRGRVEINAITAREILLPRLPPPGATDSAPEAAAEPFRLPELPVSIQIGELAVDRIVLGAPVIGQDLTGSLQGAITLDDDLNVDLALDRTDGQLGQITLRAAYSQETAAELALDLGFREGPGGIAATALGIPDSPALDLTVAGDGPLSAFAARIDLASDGQPRLSGDVTIGLEDPDGSAGDLRFAADIGGDITALLLPDAREFFGPDVALDVAGAVLQSGGVQLDRLDLRAATLALTGSARLDADNRPEAFALQGEIAAPDGSPVTLPGSDLTITALQIDAAHDRSQGDGWQAEIGLDAPNVPGFAAGRVALTASGTLAPPDAPAAVTADLDFTAAGLRPDDAALAEALGQDVTGQARVLWTDGAPLEIDGFRIGGSDYAIALDGRAAIADRGLTVAGEIALDLADLSRFSALAGQPLTGSIEGTLTGGGDPLGGLFDAELALRGAGLSTGIAQADALIASGVSINGRAARDQRGIALEGLELRADGLDLTLDGTVTPQDADLQLDLALARMERFVPELPGDLRVTGTAGRAGDAPWTVDLALDAPRGITARVDGQAGGDTSIMDLTAELPDFGPFVPTLPGPARAEGRVTLAGSDWAADLEASLPKGLALDVAARAEGAGAVVDYVARLADVAAFAEGFPGPAQITGTARSTDMAAWGVTAFAAAPQGVTANVDARYDGTIAASFEADVENVARLAPGFPGAASLSGTVAQQGDAFVLDTTASGPFGVTANITARLADAITAQITANLPDVAPLAPGISGALQLTGDVAQQGDFYGLNFAVDGPGAAATRLTGGITADAQARALQVTGSAPVALANRLLEPRAVFGTARYDLALDGPLALSNVTGRVDVTDARVTLPTVNKALNDLTATVTLAGGTAQIDMGSAFSDGGRVSLGGRIALGGSLPANLQIRLLDLALRDGAFYETSLAGGINIEGPLSGGARISGQIDLGATEVRLAETGLSFGGAIPEGLRHVGEPGAVRASRGRAGLLERASAGGGGGGAAYPLDVRINAPGRIFLRGRGLDAEIGGQLRVGGTSADIRPEGQFELIRGRLDLLGRRLTLDEGVVTLAGDLVPALRLQASIPGPELTAFVTMTGTATAPEIKFSSEPELPEDEVLAQAFFGQSLSSLSPLQAARLAAGVATLAGRGGGTLDRLRGALGGADLDVTQTADGATALSFGTYIGENAYTDVTTSSDGDAQVNLKIDLTDTVTVQGSADNSGDTSLGIFFERDY